MQSAKMKPAFAAAHKLKPTICLKLMKQCSRCEIYKSFEGFNKSSNAKDGLHTQCRDCRKQINNQWYQTNQEEHLQKVKSVYIKRPPRTKIKDAGGIKEYKRRYEANRLKTDIQYKLAKILRIRLNVAIKNKYKAGSAVADLGCSIDEFKFHIEQQFRTDMSWSNYGEWELDHIIPLSSFDLTNREQFLKACNYKNMQPLWKKDNRIKSDRMS